MYCHTFPVNFDQKTSSLSWIYIQARSGIILLFNFRWILHIFNFVTDKWFFVNQEKSLFVVLILYQTTFFKTRCRILSVLDSTTWRLIFLLFLSEFFSDICKPKNNYHVQSQDILPQLIKLIYSVSISLRAITQIKTRQTQNPASAYT